VPLVVSPLIRIEPHGRLPDLGPIRTLIFTSRAGVDAFADQSNRRDLACYTVGDATADLARDRGMKATSCNGNANGLVARMLADGVRGPCLHIRGEHAVGDIAAHLTAAGIQTTEAVLYRQVAQPLTAAACALLHREAPVIIPLFSPRSARLISNGFSSDAPLFVVAMSKAVAKDVGETVRAGNLQALVVSRTPDAAAMADAIRAVLTQANALEGD